MKSDLSQINAQISSQIKAVIKTGDGSTTYTTAGTSYAAVDATNLAYTVTIPVGQNLLIWAQGRATVGSSGTTFGAIVDGSTVLAEDSVTAAGSWKATALIVGDGASHVIQLQSKHATAAGTIVNTSATATVTMAFLLTC